MDKTIIKTVTKALKVNTLKACTKTFFTNCIFKNNSIKAGFYITVKNLRGEYKEQWKG